MPIEPTALQTDRLLIRPFEWADIDDYYQCHNDQAFRRLLDEPYPYRRKDAERDLGWVISKSWDKNPYFALVLNKIVVGHADLEIGLGGLGEAAPGIADLSYALARPYWGQGLMPEACRAIMAYAFPTYNLVKITAVTTVENRPSWRVMEKLGMKREGLFRQHGVGGNGQRADQVVYGFLRGEYEAWFKP
ncbi:MAG: GNAT family N-acetyltransferase [Candidatus Latescibacteria bacterium]|nr:GNAT family N-acetyltransferase [Candidatus Latescibacterota bacterium]